MPVRGIKETRAGLRRVLADITGPVTELTLSRVLIIGAGRAAIMTPVDTSNLINSQYRRVERGRFGAWGRVGYTAAYAAAVHAASGKLKGQPRADFGTTRDGVAFGGGTGVGNYWDPAGEPKFLERGFDESRAQIWAEIKRGYKV